MRPARLHALLLCAAVVVFFHPAVSFPFLTWDDEINVTGNPHVAGGTWSGLVELWKEPYASLYVPVSYTWFWLLANASRFTMPGGTGLDPRLFHGTNLLLHMACALIVYRIVSRLVASRNAAFAGALVFALHPLVSEPVAWVTEARGLLSAALAFTALDLLLAVAAGDKSGTPLAPEKGRTPLAPEKGGTPLAPEEERAAFVGSAWRLALATVCFAAAMLAKPQAAALPLMALVLDRWFVGRPWRRILPGVAAGLVLALGMFAITKAVQSDDTLRDVAPIWSRPLVALDALGFYTWKALVPAGLATDYGRTPAWLLESLARAWPALVPLAIVAALWLARRARRGLAAYAVFAAALLPVLGLIPFAFQDVSTVADRYAYLALLGMALAVAMLLERVPTELQWTAAVALAACLGMLARSQLDTWRSNEALFARVLAVNPRSYKAEGNLGIVASRAGRLDDAIRHYERALEIGPKRWIVYQNLGLALGQQGKLAEAADAFTKSLELRPDNAPVSLRLGAARLQLGQYAEAEAALRAALAANPKSPDAQEWLGVTLLALDKSAEAATLLRSALESRDTPEVRKNLAQALMMTGDAKGAAEQLRAVLKVKPGWPEAEIDLAWVLATAPDEEVRSGSEAMSLAIRAQSASKTPSARYVDTLAAAMAATGRFEDAAKTAERAKGLAAPTETAYAERIEQRRQAYLAGQAWRDLVR
jgi:tetratricopeptide (TPR) repeat protein